MKHPSKTNLELLEEIIILKRRIQELEQSKLVCGHIEKTSKENDQRFRSLMEATSDCIWEIRTDGHFIYVSPKIKNLLGYEPEDIIGKTLFEFLTKDEAERIGQLFKNISELRQSFSGLESASLHRDGRKIIFETSGVPVVDAMGNLVGYRGFTRDITERKKIEDTLRTSQLRLSEAMDLAHIVYWEFDLKDNVFIFNDPFYAFYGTNAGKEGGYRMSREEYAKRFVHPDDRQFFYQIIEQNNAAEGPDYSTDVEHRIIRRNDNEVRHILTRIRIIFDDTGCIIKRFGANQDITDLKLVIEAHKASEEKYRKIFEGTAEGIFQTTPEGKYLSINPAFARMSGYASPQEMIDSITNIGEQTYVNPQNREEMIQRIREHDRIDGFEVEIYRKDKSRFWISFNIHTVRDTSGNILYLEGTNTDITERKKAEDELREREALLNIYLDNAPDGIYLSDMNGNVIYSNRKCEEITGYRRDELIGKNFLKMNQLSEKNLSIIASLLHDSAEGKSTGPAEFELINNEGRHIPVEINAAIVQYKDQKIILSSIRDITDRKLAERTLVESEEKYRNVIENSLIGFYILKNKLFRYVNRQFCEIMGYTYEEIVDKLGPLDLVFPDDREMMAENIRKRTNGETDRVEYNFRGIRKDSRVINIKIIGTTMTYEGERVITGTILDVTREQKLENQLRQSQKMEAIGTLAGGIAHDFNNIITVLMGYASLILSKMNTSDPLRSYMDQILFASQKAVDLTRSLLTFSRQQPVTLMPLSINNAIKAAEKLLNRLLTEDIEFRICLTDDDPIVMADKSQIDQILFNLVANARDSMPKGGVLAIKTVITIIGDTFIKTHGFGEAGKYAEITVSDTGMGMDETTKEKIFDPFFTTKEVGKGTGLGLATVYGIVNQHKGYITVQSTLNQGTTFHIYLPATKMKVDEKKDTVVSINRGKETILIAEDNEDVRHFMREALKAHGYIILEAIDGEDALEKFNQHRDIDLIIIDSVMPKKNGRETYKEIHSIDPNIKVLFTSGYTRDVILDKGIEEKELDFIAKPLLLNELLQKVREVLDR